jgi:hypothetical protein
MTEEELTVMIVELRLDGMPEEALEHYKSDPDCLLVGAYHLWFKDPEWKQVVLDLQAKGAFAYLLKRKKS